MTYDIRQIFDFLTELKLHNDVEWMHAHRAAYEQARDTFYALSVDIMGQMAQVDPSLRGLDPRQCIFRLARDTRFSWDKSPYKTHLALYLTPGGKKQVGAGYYLHLSPTDPDGEYFRQTSLVVGLHCPPTAAARMVRQAIYDRGQSLTRVVHGRAFREAGFELWEGDRLKTLPAQWKGSPYDEWLRLKNWDYCLSLSDEQALSDDFTERVVEAFRAGKPLNDFFNRALGDVPMRSAF